MQKNNAIPINVTHFTHPETGTQYFTAENDIMFHILFASSVNEEVTKTFYESVLEEPIGEDITVNVNPEIIRRNIKDKQMIGDVKAIGKQTESIYLMEMQIKASNAFVERLSNYTHKTHVETLEKKMKYTQAKRATMVAIVANNIPKFKGIEEYHTVWNAREKIHSDYVIDENVTIHVIELKKYIAYKKKTGKVNIWLEFLINPLGSEVKEKMRTEKELRLAVDMLNLLNSDEEVRAIADAEKWAEIEKNMEMAEMHRDGLEQGMEQGRKKREKEIIEKMLKNGITLDKIAEMLEMKVEEVEELLEKNNEVA